MIVRSGKYGDAKLENMRTDTKISDFKIAFQTHINKLETTRVRMFS